MSYYIKVKKTGQIILTSPTLQYRDHCFRQSFELHLTMGGREDNFALETSQDEESVNIVDKLPAGYVPATSDEDINILNNAEFERAPLDWDEEMKEYRAQFNANPPKLI